MYLAAWENKKTTEICYGWEKLLIYPTLTLYKADMKSLNINTEEAQVNTLKKILKWNNLKFSDV